jgi:hypothetical protein
MWTRVGDWWTGTSSFRYGASGAAFTYDGVMGVSDEARLHALMRRAFGMFQPGGAFHQLYQAMGMDLSADVEETTRTHAGVTVHGWATAWKADALVAEQAELLRWMPRDWYVAVVEGNALFSNDAAGIDRMIDEAKAGEEPRATLEAERVFGAGKQAYMDFDFLEMVRSMAKSLGGPEAATLEALAQNAPASSPVSVSVSFEDNRMRFQTRVPSALVQAFATIGSEPSESATATATDE